ncbi:sulfotransferase family 2 domain-containing protein [Sorangium sp. So ce185]|uniref:sulfotransferase family 2 domain-containing protein n=1 Tax=Sorangium sp. So ce185 TaxID=3133287 RepID=UPI003F60FB4F
MIFPEHRTIFFHVPRTGGTSVELMFMKRLLDPSVMDRDRLWGPDRNERFYLQHATCATTLRLIGRERFDAYFKFAVVRNPFSRMVSTYYYLLPRHEKMYGSFKGYLRALPELIELPTNKGGGHQTPQREFTHLGGEQAVNVILKFEDLPGCMDTVRARLGITDPLPHVNETRFPSVKRTPTAAHYDAESVDIVLRVYADDFRLFGYSPAPPQSSSGAPASSPAAPP